MRPPRDQLQGVLELEEDAVAASWTVVDDRLARWQAAFDDAFALVAGRFAQADSRRRARMYLLGRDCCVGGEQDQACLILLSTDATVPNDTARDHARWPSAPSTQVSGTGQLLEPHKCSALMLPWVSGRHARGEDNCRSPSFVRELVTVDEVCPLAMRNKAV